MADRLEFAAFLGVARSKVPGNPDGLPEPKLTLVNLARASRKKAIREDLVPRPGSGRTVGPAYASWLIEFAGTSWRPAEAAMNSDSLRRAITCLERLVAAR